MAIFCQPLFPSRSTCEILRVHARWAGRPLLFVGDLDPLDLTIFAALRARNPELRHSPSTAVPVQYLGIDDRWLGLCRSYLRPTIKSVQSIAIKMGATEMEHLQVVKRVLSGLVRMIGPECLALLESGRKLELEGSGHPGLYRKGFSAKLAKVLPSNDARGHTAGR